MTRRDNINCDNQYEEKVLLGEGTEGTMRTKRNTLNSEKESEILKK